MVVRNVVRSPVRAVVQSVFGEGESFHPFQLFRSGAQGAWYDPSDFSTLYQDAAGTTPVTAVEQPVRLMLDRSRGLVLGSELVTNGGFDTDTAWTKGTGWTISGGVASISGATSNSDFSTTGGIAVVDGTSYLIEFDILSISANGRLFILDPDFLTTAITTTGRISRVVRSSEARGNALSIRAISSDANPMTASIDNVTVRELPGNHAVAPNDASRPVLRSRYNLLTRSEEFDNAAWANTIQGTGLAPTITANAGTDPLGGSTADRLQFSLDGGTTTSDITRRRQSFTTPATSHTFSVYLRSTDGVSSYNMHIVGPSGNTTNIVVTGAWQRFTVTEIGSGGATTYSVGLRGGQSPANANTADVLAWGASLLTAADHAATGGAYQRVGAATDYDTGPPWRPYLAFDGSDDSFSTSSIDFSGTDKVTIFAGLTNLVSSTQIIAELTDGAVADNLFALFQNNTNTMAFRSAGTTDRDATSSAVLIPVTNVYAGLGDVSADVSILRINGAQAATNAGDQGTGNYANAALFIGRRNNTSLPFNGRLYSLAVLGRTATAPELSAMESWIAGKTGVTI